jgi:hypothetical protein
MVTESISKAMDDLNKRLDERDAAVEKRIKDYIEELRTTAAPGKSAMVTPEEPKEEKPQTEKEIREQLRKQLHDKFKVNN